MFTENVRINSPVKVLRAVEGILTDHMPELLADGRTPLSFRGLMERRLGSNEDAETLRNFYVTTGSPLLVSPNRDVIVTSADNPVTKSLVEGLNPESKLNSGYSLVVDESVYDAAEKGERMIIPSRIASKLRSDPYIYPSFREKFFEFQAGSRELAQEYGNLVNKVTGTDIKCNRGIWLPRYKGMRLISVSPFRDRSAVNGYNISSWLYFKYARLVGVSNGVASTEGVGASSVDVLVRNALESRVRDALGEYFRQSLTDEIAVKIYQAK